MRIRILTNEYEPNILGGLGIVSTRLAEALAARGHDITVITKTRKRQIEESHRSGVRIIRFPLDSEYHSLRYHQFYAGPILNYLKKTSPVPDLIHVHSLQMDALTYAMTDEHAIKGIYTCHSLIAEEKPRSQHSMRMEARQRQLIARVATVISPSRWQARILQQDYKATHCKVIPNGVQTAILRKRPPKTRLLFAGRLVRPKGIEELIRAMAIVLHTHANVRLDIRGTGSERFTHYLQRLIKQLRLEHAVRLLGASPQQAVFQSMQEYYAVVVPSRNESFGLVALEAMATGTPLITTRAGGLRDFVDGQVAVIIAKQTANEIARSILFALQHPRHIAKLRHRALKRAENYAWPHIAALYEGCMEKMVNKSADEEQ